METPVIRVVRSTEASAYFTLRLSLLRSDPLAYTTTAADYASRRLADVAERLQVTDFVVTYGAYLGGELVGILTLKRHEQASLKHRAEVLAVGVLPAARGYGCASGLMRAAITHARRWEGVERLDLAVSETQQAALRLYEQWGFAVWGVQEDGLRGADGQGHALHYLSLKL